MLASVVLALCVGNAFGQNPPPSPTTKPAAPPAEKLNSKEAAAIAAYEIGRNAGENFKEDDVEIDLDLFIQGLKDGYKGAKAKYTPQQIQSALMVFKRDMQAKMIEKQAKLEENQRAVGDKNLREGKEFLAKNKDKKGVKTTTSGLQYEVIKSGTGATPKETDAVKVHYHGTLLDGTVFDSSVERKEPIVFPVNGVISGWTEALKLMKVGDKWKLFIPSDLAYGKQGAGRDIGPNAVLTFEVELLGIEAGKPGKGGKEIVPIDGE
jgi:FKBP-type peptidyl-prolyl cis-trans isomerase FklB